MLLIKVFSLCNYICRMLGNYKRYVRNRARPEGSIAEAYIANESITYCAMYLSSVETSFNRPQRNDDGGEKNETLSVFSQITRPFGEAPKSAVEFSKHDMEVAHWFILNNCEEVDSLRIEHEELMKRDYPRWDMERVQKKHRELFPKWFKEHVSDY